MGISTTFYSSCRSLLGIPPVQLLPSCLHPKGTRLPFFRKTGLRLRVNRSLLLSIGRLLPPSYGWNWPGGGGFALVPWSFFPYTNGVPFARKSLVALFGQEKWSTTWPSFWSPLPPSPRGGVRDRPLLSGTTFFPFPKGSKAFLRYVDAGCC